MLRLHTFGSCLLTRDGARVDALSGQRKALALLAVLAAAGPNGVSRDTLLGHLWPESDDEHARTSLKQLVHSLRSRLHAPELLLGSAELRLNPIWVTADVAEFRAALARGDTDAAAALYTGPFLDGFFLKGAGLFERWVETERAALRQDYVRVLEALAERASTNGNGRAAVEAWRRLAAADPLNAHAVVGLMCALDAVGERAAALQHARVYEQLVREELDAAPEAAVTALVERLRSARSTLRTIGTASVPPATEPVAARQPPALPAEPAPPANAVRSAMLPAGAERLRRELTRSRVARGAMLVVGTSAIVIGGFAISRPLRIGPAASMFAASARDTSNTLLVADFDIRGGLDSTLGSTLAEAVRTDLGQSRVVRIVPAVTIREALQRMQRPVSTLLVPAVARELAEREGIKAVVEGELTPLRRNLVVTVRLVSARGDQVISFHETTDEPGLIRTLGRLTGRLREKMGESLVSVRATPPLPQVTTASIPALRKYAEGRRAMTYENDRMRAAALLNEALALDSTFGMAWVMLHGAYFDAGYPPELANHAIERAYRYRDRLPELERYHAVGRYFRTGPGRDRRRAAEAFEAGLRLDSGRFANELALLYMSRREYARAESLHRWYVDRGSENPVMYYNLRAALSFQGKRAEAESLEVEVSRRFPDTYHPLRPAPFLYDRGELDSAQHVLERHLGQANAKVRTEASWRLSTLHRLRGRLAEAERARGEAAEANLVPELGPDPLGDELRAAFVDIWHRDSLERGARRVEAALARRPLASLPVLSPSYEHFYLFGESYYVWVARTYAQARRPDRARAVLAQFETDPRDTSLRRASEPAIRSVLGEIALAEGRPLVALEQFRRADRLPDGPVHRCAICRDVDVGRAFDQAGMADSAIANFERYLETPHSARLPMDAIHAPRILRRLGELYEAKGNRAKALEYYGQFVALWRNADPELQPTVDEVRRRIQSLRVKQGD